MQITEEEARRILSLIGFADDQSQAGIADLWIGVRLRDVFGITDYEYVSESYERAVAAAAALPKPPEVVVPQIDYPFTPPRLM